LDRKNLFVNEIRRWYVADFFPSAAKPSKAYAWAFNHAKGLKAAFMAS
jgi:hypothetical protein